MQTDASSMPKGCAKTRAHAGGTISAGDRVTVNPGVLDPAIEALRKDGMPTSGICIEGWAGLVREISTDSEGNAAALVEWDSHTLTRVPQNWLAFYQLLDATNPDQFGFMVLGLDQIERHAGSKKSHKTDTVKKRIAARRAIAVQFEWADRANPHAQFGHDVIVGLTPRT